MNCRLATIKNENGSAEVYFVGIEHWDDYDLLLGLLQQENSCEIISNQERIYARRAELIRNGIKFQLIQDDMLGNYLYTDDSKIVPTLEQLANSVINSIKLKLKNSK
jgi:hypothetical protein